VGRVLKCAQKKFIEKMFFLMLHVFKKNCRTTSLKYLKIIIFNFRSPEKIQIKKILALLIISKTLKNLEFS
jgi:hypothetical protein